MKAYIDVYKNFINSSVSEASTYRFNFFLLVLLDITFICISLYTVNFMFDHISHLGPWSKEQFLFFTAYMILLDVTHMMVLSENFWFFSYALKMGALDFTLLKPISSIFISFFRYFRPSSLVGILIMVPLLIYFGLRADLSLIAWMILPFLFFLSFLLLAQVEFIIASAMFWVIDGFGINFLRMQFQQLGKWPEYIYTGFARKFLLLALPVLLIGSAPLHFLFDLSLYHWPLYLIVANIAMNLLLRFLWNLGLKHYESASS
jgi:ABC-2 type transport system permease protein